MLLTGATGSRRWQARESVIEKGEKLVNGKKSTASTDVTGGKSRQISHREGAWKVGNWPLSLDIYILLDVLVFSIAVYFYELCRILTSP